MSFGVKTGYDGYVYWVPRATPEIYYPIFYLRALRGGAGNTSEAAIVGLMERVCAAASKEEFDILQTMAGAAPNDSAAIATAILNHLWRLGAQLGHSDGDLALIKKLGDFGLLSTDAVRCYESNYPPPSPPF